MAGDDRTRELEVSGWLPGQRTPAYDRAPSDGEPSGRHADRSAPSAPLGDIPPPWRGEDEETLLLPVVAAGTAPADSAVAETWPPAIPDAPTSAVPTIPAPANPALPSIAEPAPPSVPKPVDRDRLPNDERYMLIFVTALLALGTLAIVAMASIGR